VFAGEWQIHHYAKPMAIQALFETKRVAVQSRDARDYR
jgi:hypothetical protein